MTISSTRITKDKMQIPLLPTFRFTHFAMGTNFEVVISGHLQENARKLSAVLFDEIDRLENLLSRFNPQSEISRINRLKPGESMFLPPETFACLEIAEAVQRETGRAETIASSC